MKKLLFLVTALLAMVQQSSAQTTPVITVADVEAQPGETVDLILNLTGGKADQYTSLQFDAQFPSKGFTIKSDGYTISDKWSGTDELTKVLCPEGDITVDDNGVATIPFACANAISESNVENLVTIKVNVPDDATIGEQNITLKNIKLGYGFSDKDIPSDINAKLIIYKLGDVNSDVKINVADFIGVANYILGNAATTFVKKAADVNEDGKINVADFIGIANIILQGNNTANSRSTVFAAPRRAATNIDALDDVIYVEPVTVQAGQQQVLSIKMKNTGNVVGYEFSLQLPDGVTVATDGDDMLMAELSTERTTAKKTDYFNSALQSDGTLKVLCGTSTQNPNTGKLYAFSGNDGEVARITVNVANNVEDGEYPVIIKNAVITDTESQATELTPSVETTLTVGQSVIVLDENSTTLPENATSVNVRVKRTINANEWSTICLPFAMNAEQVTAAFGSGVELADFTGTDTKFDNDDNVIGITVNFNPVTAIEANRPYIIKVVNKVTTFTMENVDINSDEDKAYFEFDNGKTGSKRVVYSGFYGTYHAETVLDNNTLFLSENKFWYSSGNTKMKAFRAYFDFLDVLTDKTASGARMLLSFDEETTSIQNPKFIIRNNTSEWYTLDGRKLDKKPTAKGVYVKDGRKVVIK